MLLKEDSDSAGRFAAIQVIAEEGRSMPLVCSVLGVSESGYYVEHPVSLAPKRSVTTTTQ